MSSTRKPPHGGPVLSVRDAIDVLRTPGGREAFSPVCSEPYLAVDLTRDAGLECESSETLAKGLADLACPTLGWHPEPSRADVAPWLEAFDVVVATASDLDCVRTTCQNNPLAALALVQTLRRTLRGSIQDGLWAESLSYSVLQSGPEFSRWLALRESAAPSARVGSDSILRVSREGPRLELVLDRPEKRNAFSSQLRDLLAAALEVAVVDPEVREIVWRAEGPAFCAGGDLDEFGSFPDPATAHGVRSTRHVARLIAALASQLRVEVQGACVGAGVELPAFAARVTARRDAFFELPEVAMGLIPGAGGTVSLPRRIGRQRTAWMALTGARVDAETAYAWGLVDDLRD